jgi:hypothetical protein
MVERVYDITDRDALNRRSVDKRPGRKALVDDVEVELAPPVRPTLDRPDGRDLHRHVW